MVSVNHLIWHWKGFQRKNLSHFSLCAQNCPPETEQSIRRCRKESQDLFGQPFLHSCLLTRELLPEPHMPPCESVWGCQIWSYIRYRLYQESFLRRDRRPGRLGLANIGIHSRLAWMRANGKICRILWTHATFLGTICFRTSLLKLKRGTIKLWAQITYFSTPEFMLLQVWQVWLKKSNTG